MPQKYTTEEWVKLAKQKWGDKYNYEKVVYKNSGTKVTLICNIHGEFDIWPRNHFQVRSWEEEDIYRY